MPKHLIYKLKIDGSYTPDTIPMQRLSEYMSDLASLLGEAGSVHFEHLEEGSVYLAAVVDEPAIPKVMNRVVLHERGEATDDFTKAFAKLDKRLAEDNATGSLQAFADETEAGAVVLAFPGKDRPKPLDYGIVRQQGSIEGVPVTVGGRDKTAHVILEDRHNTYSGINVSREQAREIAPHLYAHILRLHGTGSWKRDEDGEWKLQRFSVKDVEVLDNAPLREVLEHLRAVPNNGWSEIEDPARYLEDLRDDGPEERPH